MAKTAHLDTFARDHLPPPEAQPVFDLKATPEIAAYPERMNCAAELLDKQAATYGDRPAYHFGDETWTYSDLLARTNQIAHVLKEELGVQPGNRVMIRGFNNPMFVAIWFAVMKVGGIVVATMPLYRWRELTFMADKAEVGVALCDWRLHEEMDQTVARTQTMKRVVWFNKPGDAAALEPRMAQRPTSFATLDTAADDICMIAFTSGTTGQAKGAMHCHRDIMAICDTFSRYVLKPTKDDVFSGSPPIAFAFGLGAHVAFPLHAGASTVLVEQYTPQLMLETIQKKKVTILFTSPAAFRGMTDLAKNYGLSSIRECVSAGETLPKPVWEGWHQATGNKIIDGIGSTEMLHIFIACQGDAIRPGSTGKAIPGYRAKVVDENGNEVPPGQVGRLAVQGPTGCRYLANPERQAAYVQGGWNFTGDAYMRDADGYFWYQARTDDMIVSSGYNISGNEVESVLLLHPAVKECAVIGWPDKQRGQVVKAFVVPRDPAAATPETVKALQDFVKAELAPYKYPRAVEFIAELPRTETGKVQRFKLRERAGGG
jgi:2-aminobenzoate-CoA ligase